MNGLVLHGYWRSSASYRVRIALNLKGVEYRQVTHDLKTGAQRNADYRARAPHGLVPAIEHDGEVLIESPAILEWIETRWPEPQLLPASPEDAAAVRAMAALIACEIHPLGNLRVLDWLRGELGAVEPQVTQWVAHWIGEGFGALETLIARHGRAFAFGDAPTLVDVYLVPQVYNALRFGLDLDAFPRICATNARMLAIPAVARAHPDLQPDANP
ncbi:MAG: maleylacetoacetate isomerase [Novosphingobium sp.]